MVILDCIVEISIWLLIEVTVFVMVVFLEVLRFAIGIFIAPILI